MIKCEVIQFLIVKTCLEYVILNKDPFTYRIRLILSASMRQLEVLIIFDPVPHNVDIVTHWCDNIKLFIVYGTNMEVLPNCEYRIHFFSVR